MKCPTCPETTLVMSDRQGVEIDYCPNCRGVWLDRGELDKIIERVATVTPAPTAPAPQPRRRDDDDDDDDRRDARRPVVHHEVKPYKKSKSKSILGEIFDF